MQDGYALSRVLSVRIVTAADTEARRLQRRGFQTATRALEIPGKGLWFRVYVGSFQTRSEALKAAGPLMEKLKVDWSRATQF